MIQNREESLGFSYPSCHDIELWLQIMENRGSKTDKKIVQFPFVKSLLHPKNRKAHHIQQHTVLRCDVPVCHKMNG